MATVSARSQLKCWLPRVFSFSRPPCSAASLRGRPGAPTRPQASAPRPRPRRSPTVGRVEEIRNPRSSTPSTSQSEWRAPLGGALGVLLRQREDCAELRRYADSIGAGRCRPGALWRIDKAIIVLVAAVRTQRAPHLAGAVAALHTTQYHSLVLNAVGSILLVDTAAGSRALSACVA